MCRAMEEMVKEATFRAKVDAAIQIMKRFNVTAQEALNILGVSEADYARYMAAIG